jgi:hypothetical protein
MPAGVIHSADKATGFTCDLQFSMGNPEAADLLVQLTQFKSNDPELEPPRDLKMVETRPSVVSI